MGSYAIIFFMLCLLPQIPCKLTPSNLKTSTDLATHQDLSLPSQNHTPSANSSQKDSFGPDVHNDGDGVRISSWTMEDTAYWEQQQQQSLEDSLIFQYSSSNHVYDVLGEVNRKMPWFDQLLLTKAAQQARNYLPKYYELLSSMRRYLPKGIEWDLSYLNSHNQDTVQLTAFQELGPLRFANVSTSPDTEVVNIIVPLKGRLSKYSLFLDHLVVNILPKIPQLTLTVACHHDDLLNVTQELTRMKLSQVPNFTWNFISVKETDFSRGLLRHMGVESVRKTKTSGTLLFFCDVDVHIKPEFFSRCKSNSIQDKQVYFPIVFSMYNPQLIYGGKKVPTLEDQVYVDEETGFWRSFGFGMACMYISDYDASGGFPDISAWGNEDVVLYENFLNMPKMKVIRSPDPGLFHIFHGKECNGVGSNQYPSCLKSKALNEGSLTQLWKEVVRLHGNTDVQKLLEKIIYSMWVVRCLIGVVIISLLTNIVQAIMWYNTKSRSKNM